MGVNDSVKNIFTWASQDERLIIVLKYLHSNKVRAHAQALQEKEEEKEKKSLWGFKQVYININQDQ